MAKRILTVVMILLFIVMPVDVGAQTDKTPEEIYSDIKDNLLAHKKEFTITMDTKTMDEIGNDTNLFDTITNMDDQDTSKDADYLETSISSWSQSWKWSSRGTATLTFSAKYKSTLKQEAKVDIKIEKILKKLKLEDATDYEKVKAIHDYIINLASYDQTYKKHTAYNTLINKSSVCEGYAAAAYRLFTEAGIKCRIITGDTEGGAHAWNIVFVDGKWYNIDLTWDDPISSSGESILRYDYFLKNQKDFSDHVRDAEYNTKAFLRKYKMTEDSYEVDESD